MFSGNLASPLCSFQLCKYRDTVKVRSQTKPKSIILSVSQAHAFNSLTGSFFSFQGSHSPKIICAWPKPGNAIETTMGRGISSMFQGGLETILKSSFSLWLLWCLSPFPSSCRRKCKWENIHYTLAGQGAGSQYGRIMNSAHAPQQGYLLELWQHKNSICFLRANKAS